ncbi:hypothetical protein [Thiocystis violacea]|uniref:hypothetical protein n=1 Tax=Thiocystis violacea TaxID=13725 RepID=UPI00190355C7|nr:hypothetical protein [Thiocystis violacea]MBK1719108.1 hypothetical protein [Thiocystis violacea]
MEDFKRDTRRLLIEHAHEFAPEERQARLKRLAVEDRRRGLDPELIRDWLKRGGQGASADNGSRIDLF